MVTEGSQTLSPKFLLHIDVILAMQVDVLVARWREVLQLPHTAHYR